jgi:hypothetical protein
MFANTMLYSRQNKNGDRKIDSTPVLGRPTKGSTVVGDGGRSHSPTLTRSRMRTPCEVAFSHSYPFAHAQSVAKQRLVFLTALLNLFAYSACGNIPVFLSFITFYLTA